MLHHIDICISARNETDQLVGICFGLTDFAYFPYLTDLGVDRQYTRKGIGSEMVTLAHQQSGGTDDICMITYANPKAIEFYEYCGMKRIGNAVAKEAEDWDLFVVGMTNPNAT